MARLSLVLLVAALLQAGSSLPIVEEGQFSPTSQQFSFPTRLPTGFPTGLPTGTPTALPTGFPTELPSGFPTAFPTGFPTGVPDTGYSPFPTGFPHQHPLHNPEPEGKPAPPEKRNIPVAPKWLRWLPFENINL